MAKFVRKPVIVEAKQMKQSFTVQTEYGKRQGNAGDWLVTGVNGEPFVFTHQAFTSQYDPVDNNDLGSTDDYLSRIHQIFGDPTD